jgi:pimeloyl-ACP methyl ester carboxylesterase
MAAGQSSSSDDSLERIDSSPSDEFEYPYFLYTPPDASDDEETRLLVEPVNTGRPDDDFSAHEQAARQTALGSHNGGVGRVIADELAMPLLVPAFPRPVSKPVDWTHAVHALDARTLRIEDGPLERIDRQLLAMIADARERLAERGVETESEVALNGFSSSAQFVARFTALHPNRVAAVTAGGHNGLLILPETEAETDVSISGARKRELNYPVGVADLESLTGEPFDRDAFASVDLFGYIGADDRTDSLKWPDMWTDTELRATAILVYGPHVREDRVPVVREAYRKSGVNAVFHTYADTGHDPTPAVEDVVAFHRQSLAGADAEALRKTVES